MTEHKFTDEEVIKALELHSTAYEPCVDKCVYGKERCCGSKMAKDALDLINRQKAEIEEKAERLRNVLPLVAGLKAGLKIEAIQEYLAKVLEKKDTASHYAPGAEVVTVEVLEHYARQFTEGSGE